VSWLDRLEPYWELITAAGAFLGPCLSVITIVWVLATKKNATSAVAWCLFVFFLPLLGPVVFLLFGYQHVNRPLSRKRRQRRSFQRRHPSARGESAAPDVPGTAGTALRGFPDDLGKPARFLP